MKRMVHGSKGFTLVELLVVIAVLGVLAGAILIAINPLEQLARGRDAGRLATINDMGKAAQNYYTNNTATYATTGITWMTTLQTAGDLKVVPTNPTATGYTIGCNTAATAQNGYCYNTSATPEAIVYARAESKSFNSRAGCTGVQQAWIVWSSAEGKSGLTCTTNTTTDPAVGITGLK